MERKGTHGLKKGKGEKIYTEGQTEGRKGLKGRK